MAQPSAEMNLMHLWARMKVRCRRGMAEAMFRQPVQMRNTVPLISFTFDDFPRSAYLTGGDILRHHGICGTYYTSLGLAGQHSSVGTCFSLEDLKPLIDEGNELGCHTYAHCDAWETNPREFEKSILENKLRLSELLPEAEFKTLSYPINHPRPHTKRRTARHFMASRCGGQRFNSGVLDLNLLSAYFLEIGGYDLREVEELIARNCAAKGWLIFATHDVCENPTRYGCTPTFFEEVVKASVASGAKVLPVTQALELVLNSNAGSR